MKESLARADPWHAWTLNFGAISIGLCKNHFTLLHDLGLCHFGCFWTNQIKSQVVNRPRRAMKIACVRTYTQGPRCGDPIKAQNQIFCFFDHQILLFCLMQGFRVFVFSSRIDHILLPHCSTNIPAILPQIGVFHLFRVSNNHLFFWLLFGVARVPGPNPPNQASPRSISTETKWKRKDSTA